MGFFKTLKATLNDYLISIHLQTQTAEPHDWLSGNFSTRELIGCETQSPRSSFVQTLCLGGAGNLKGKCGLKKSRVYFTLMNWEAVAKPSIRWIITKVVFHESQLESKNKSIAGKGSALSMLIYHWLLILMFDNKTTSILFLFSLVAFSFCWGSPLHHFWLIKKKKGFIFTSRIKKKVSQFYHPMWGECIYQLFFRWLPSVESCLG